MGQFKARKVSKVPKIPRWLKIRRSVRASRATIGLVKKFVAVFEESRGALEPYNTVKRMFKQFSPTQRKVAVSALGKVLTDHPKKTQG